MKSISNKPKGTNSKNKKARVVILEYNMSSHPVLHFYQVSSKFPKGIQVTEWTRNFTLTQTTTKQYVPLPFGRGWGDICFLELSEGTQNQAIGVRVIEVFCTKESKLPVCKMSLQNEKKKITQLYVLILRPWNSIDLNLNPG